MKFYIDENEYIVKKKTEQEFIKEAIADKKIEWLIESIEREIKADISLKVLVSSGLVLVIDENKKSVSKKEHSKGASKKIAANTKTLRIIKEIRTRLQV